jgi:hypothetical protein
MRHTSRDRLSRSLPFLPVSDFPRLIFPLPRAGLKNAFEVPILCLLPINSLTVWITDIEGKR